MGKTGLGFLNMMPKLGETYYNFFSSFFTNLFHGIYNQQINRNKSEKVIIVFFAVIGISTIVATSINTFLNTEKTEQVQVVKKEKKLKKVEIEKPKVKEKKLEKAKIIKPKVKEKKEV